MPWSVVATVIAGISIHSPLDFLIDYHMELTLVGGFVNVAIMTFIAIWIDRGLVLPRRGNGR